MEIHAFPRIGDVAVSGVTSADVLEILTPIWHTKGPTARFVRMRVRAVLEWAIAMEWRTDNPCDRLLHLLPRMPRPHLRDGRHDFPVRQGLVVRDDIVLGTH